MTYLPDFDGPQQDPVCGQEVEPHDQTTVTAVYQGERYYFCSEACKEAFEEDPERWIEAEEYPPNHPAAFVERDIGSF